MSFQFGPLVIQLVIAFLAVGSYWLARMLLRRYGLEFLRRARPTWVEPVVKSRLFFWVALLAPLLVISIGSDLLEGEAPKLYGLVSIAVGGIAVVLFSFILSALITIALNLYDHHPLSKEVPLVGLAQLARVTIFLIAGFMVLAIILGVPWIYAFVALAGVLTALGFVFHDPILGFIAGIQLAGNKMVALGDWIQMESYGADGAVQQITMTTVKVTNWDNTVTTIPTYALVSNSFRNWRHVSDIGARRIKRAVSLDMHTIRPCTEDIIAATAPLRQSLGDSGASDGETLNDDELRTASSKLTNLGLLRAYLLAFLHHHPQIRQDMTLIVRQLDSTEDGLPLELYAYCRATDFVGFEAVQSALFEHVFAVIPSFGLRVYQRARSGKYDEPAPALTESKAPAN